jgi:hypothetical protein
MTNSGWLKMALAVQEAALELHAIYGDKGIPSAILKRKIEYIGGYGFDSVIPSDYCYNLINKALFSFQYLLLIHITRGRYKYVGPGYSYTGSVTWKPKKGMARQVGEWKNGICRLDHDPRIERIPL